MTVTLNLPPPVEQAFIAEAHAKGVSLARLLSDVLLSRSLANPSQSTLPQGLGLFGSPEDAALIDEVVAIAYEERRRPTARHFGGL
jgi:hypothetical protein